MKTSKTITALILTAALASGGVSVFAAEDDAGKAEKDIEKQEQTVEKETDKITVKINDKEVDFAEYDNVVPYIENDRTLIPIRAIAEGLGLEVSWDEAERKVTIDGKSKIVLTIDSALAEVDGESVELEAAAHIVDDRTFVPLRFISENMGTEVEWDETTRTVTIAEKRDEGERGPGGPGGQGGPGGPGGGITAGSQGDRKPNVETDPEIVAVINEGAEKFAQFTFEDEEAGISLEYSLYVPENYDENEKYPMLMYIPDASGASKSAKEIVEQYYGADIWVTDEEQAKHKSFVLVPAFSEVVVDDDWNTSEQIETAVKLINYLTENYSIDTDRLYTTGQSMGCMTSLYLNSKYPDLFAASLFVSGQWDISVLQPLEGKKFFYITAGGDEKASGGQDEVKAMFDADGVGYSYGTWSAQNSEEEQSSAAEALIAEGHDVNMIRFEKGTVLAEGSGMEHNASFNYGYRIPAVRDWIFEQSK
ncbi:MAG: stalk domain-containing protein [Candidatus Ornithomonoglobus sp.]